MADNVKFDLPALARRLPSQEGPPPGLVSSETCSVGETREKLMITHQTAGLAKRKLYNLITYAHLFLKFISVRFLVRHIV